MVCSQARRFLRRSPCESMSSSRPMTTMASLLSSAVSPSVNGVAPASRCSLLCRWKWSCWYNAGLIPMMMKVSPTTSAISEASRGTQRFC